MYLAIVVIQQSSKKKHVQFPTTLPTHRVPWAPRDCVLNLDTGGPVLRRRDGPLPQTDREIPSHSIHVGYSYLHENH